LISAATTQFSGTPNPLPPASTPSDYGEHHQVQTGSTTCNNFAMETDIDAVSVAIPIFLTQVFHWCICQPHQMLPSPRNSKMADVCRK